MLADNFFATSNYIEAAFWIALAIGFGVATFRLPPASQTPARLAAITLAAFGLSDVVEVQTGAWWRPWWLFAWKAVCVVALLMLVIAHARRKKP